MTYWTAGIPMILRDLQGHSPIASLSNVIFRTAVDKISSSKSASRGPYAIAELLVRYSRCSTNRSGERTTRLSTQCAASATKHER